MFNSLLEHTMLILVILLALIRFDALYACGVGEYEKPAFYSDKTCIKSASETECKGLQDFKSSMDTASQPSGCFYMKSHSYTMYNTGSSSKECDSDVQCVCAQSCQSCPSGKYQDSNDHNQTACKSCPSGEVANTLKSACVSTTTTKAPADKKTTATLSQSSKLRVPTITFVCMLAFSVFAL